jgi:hypothetical protein
MKFNLKTKNTRLKLLLASGLILAGHFGMAQDRAVIADPKLSAMQLTDFGGNILDPNNLQAEQLIKLRIPVGNNNHGKPLPAGSCKIKIGLGSKLILDPGFDLGNAGMGNYFTWTATEDGGQYQVTGELVNALPADVTSVDLSFRLKVKEEGNSAITANFLITNHNSTTILSDENGANNAVAIDYKVANKLPVDPSVPAGKLQLSMFPNPVKDVNVVKITVVKGRLEGKYNISMYDLAGKLVQAKQMQLDLVPSFQYNFGYIAAGKYIIRVVNASGTETAVLKFEKF